MAFGGSILSRITSLLAHAVNATRLNLGAPGNSSEDCRSIDALLMMNRTPGDPCLPVYNLEPVRLFVTEAPANATADPDHQESNRTLPLVLGALIPLWLRSRATTTTPIPNVVASGQGTTAHPEVQGSNRTLPLILGALVPLWLRSRSTTTPVPVLAQTVKTTTTPVPLVVTGIL